MMEANAIQDSGLFRPVTPGGEVIKMSEKRAHALAVEPKFKCRDVRVFYGATEALHGIDMDIENTGVTALIGPSGCGKSTFLRVFNRMNDTIPNARVTGDILMDGENIYDKKIDPVLLRARVGMVFQKPNPFPKSIYDNVAYGPRIHGLATKKNDSK